jgi:signal transduction histidine kinase
MGQRLSQWPLAGAIFALVLVYSLGFGKEELGVPAVLVAFMACGSVALRRVHPPLALAVTVVTTLAYASLVGGSVFPIGLCVIVTLYEVGLRTPPRLAVGLTLLSVLVVYFTAGWDPYITRFQLHNGIQLGWFVAAAAAGIAVSNQHRYAKAVEERALRAEQSREAEARHMVDEERLRIAQELHDVVGHSITVINVHSGAAAHVLDSDPQAGREALLLIEKASANALAEIRATLGILQTGQRVPVPSLAPSRGLADLDELAQDARNSGLPVVLAVEGPPREVPSVVGLSVYRLVQESLTNILRHAGPVNQVRIEVTYGPDFLRVETTDDGSGPPHLAGVREPGTGMGLAGMRRRIEAVGGHLQTGPARPGGFRVMAEIPTS